MGSNPFSALEDLVDSPAFISRSHIVRKGPPRLAGRRWHVREFVSKDPSSFKFRIVSYNVLAQCYAKQKQFTKCKPEHLKWDYRKKVLIELLAELDADILCLQEVDNYDKFWERELGKAGYFGAYKQRNSHLKPKLDGCATFFRASKFQLIRNVGLELDHVDSCKGLEGAPSFETHNVALLSLFAPIGVPRCCFCVANLHLFWDPSYDNLKIAQAKAVVLAAQNLARSLDVPAPIILAGDFNSVPTSAVYSYLTEEAGFLSAYAACGSASERSVFAPTTPTTPTRDSSVSVSSTGLTFGKIMLSKGLDPQSPEFRPMGISQTLFPPAVSLAPPAIAPPRSAEPPFTNYRDIFNGTIDYIMVSRSSMPDVGVGIDVIGALGMISELEASKEGGGLPSSRHPSDHLPIAADLQLRFFT